MGFHWAQPPWPCHFTVSTSNISIFKRLFSCWGISVASSGGPQSWEGLAAAALPLLGEVGGGEREASGSASLPLALFHTPSCASDSLFWPCMTLTAVLR